MKSVSFGFRDYAVHLFPGCLLITAIFVLVFDLTWLTPSQAPLLVLAYLIGGYIVGFFIEAYSSVLLKGAVLKLSGGDALKNWLPRNDMIRSPRSSADVAVSILDAAYGKEFVRSQTSPELIYLMMRDIEADNERSSAFVSRINALENMAKNMALSCYLVVIVMAINIVVSPHQTQYSVSAMIFFGMTGRVLFLRRNAYRIWLAKSVVRIFASLDRRAQLPT